MTFKEEYTTKIKPTIIRSIQRGMFDDLISDNLLDYFVEVDILAEIKLRRAELERRCRFMQGLYA